jgi:hypothetical protein
LNERSKNINDKLESMDGRLGAFERSFEEFKKDMTDKLSNVKGELGKYSVLAAIGMAGLIFAVQQLLGK